MNNYVMDRVSVDISTSGTRYYTMSEISLALTPISGDTILQDRESWTELVLLDIGAMETLNRKYELVMDGLRMEEDFVWYYKKSEYDGFTMNQPRQAVFLFKDSAMASFYRLKWL